MAVTDRELQLLTSKQPVQRASISRIAKKVGVKVKGTNEELRVKLLDVIEQGHREVQKATSPKQRSPSPKLLRFACVPDEQRRQELLYPLLSPVKSILKSSVTAERGKQRGRYSNVHSASFAK